MSLSSVTAGGINFQWEFLGGPPGSTFNYTITRPNGTTDTGSGTFNGAGQYTSSFQNANLLTPGTWAVNLTVIPPALTNIVNGNNRRLEVGVISATQTTTTTSSSTTTTTSAQYQLYIVDSTTKIILPSGLIDAKASNANTLDDTAYIKLNGNTLANLSTPTGVPTDELNLFARGHTIAVINPDGSIYALRRYDTYNNQGNRLYNALAAIPTGKIIIIVSKDASNLSQDTRTLLNSQFGGTRTDTWTG
ncbi:MAG: hypothetical protein EBX50_19100, partial [Chitinophagia bacterium]|nr:hypothetical protein [Chitinophagia bacterium]